MNTAYHKPSGLPLTVVNTRDDTIMVLIHSKRSTKDVPRHFYMDKYAE